MGPGLYTIREQNIIERKNQNRGGNESKGKGKEQPLAIDVDSPVRERRTKAGGTDVFRTSKSGQIVDAKGKLSEDWEVRRSLGRRRRRYQYYYNHSTGEASWIIPRGSVEKGAEEGAERVVEEVSTVIDGGSEESDIWSPMAYDLAMKGILEDAQGQLPDGWEMRNNGNRTFHVDHNTRTATWDRPGDEIRATPHNQEPMAATSQLPRELKVEDPIGMKQDRKTRVSAIHDTSIAPIYRTHVAMMQHTTSQQRGHLPNRRCWIMTRSWRRSFHQPCVSRSYFRTTSSGGLLAEIYEPKK